MDKQENIKRIAEGLYPLSKKPFKYDPDGENFDHMMDVCAAHDFNPYENEADAFKVLEALRDYCREKDIDLFIEFCFDEPNRVTWEDKKSGSVKWVWSDDLKISICEAWLTINNKE